MTWRPTTLLDWLILIAGVAVVGLVLTGTPTMLRECSKPIAEMPGWCLMLVAPSR